MMPKAADVLKSWRRFFRKAGIPSNDLERALPNYPCICEPEGALSVKKTVKKKKRQFNSFKGFLGNYEIMKAAPYVNTIILKLDMAIEDKMIARALKLLEGLKSGADITILKR